MTEKNSQEIICNQKVDGEPISDSNDPVSKETDDSTPKTPVTLVKSTDQDPAKNEDYEDCCNPVNVVVYIGIWILHLVLSPLVILGNVGLWVVVAYNAGAAPFITVLMGYFTIVSIGFLVIVVNICFTVNITGFESIFSLFGFNSNGGIMVVMWVVIAVFVLPAVLIAALPIIVIGAPFVICLLAIISFPIVLFTISSLPSGGKLKKWNIDQFRDYLKEVKEDLYEYRSVQNVKLMYNTTGYDSGMPYTREVCCGNGHIRNAVVKNVSVLNERKLFKEIDNRLCHVSFKVFVKQTRALSVYAREESEKLLDNRKMCKNKEVFTKLKGWLVPSMQSKSVSFSAKKRITFFTKLFYGNRGAFLSYILCCFPGYFIANLDFKKITVKMNMHLEYSKAVKLEVEKQTPLSTVVSNVSSMYEKCEKCNAALIPNSSTCENCESSIY